MLFSSPLSSVFLSLFLIRREMRFFLLLLLISSFIFNKRGKRTLLFSDSLSALKRKLRKQREAKKEELAVFSSLSGPFQFLIRRNWQEIRKKKRAIPFVFEKEKGENQDRFFLSFNPLAHSERRKNERRKKEQGGDYEEQNEWFHPFSTSSLFSGNGKGEEEKKKYRVMNFR